MLIAKPLAGTAQTANHFANVQEDVVLLADRLNGLPVTFRRRDDAPAGGDRLEHHGPHGIRPFGKDDAFHQHGGAHAIVGDFTELRAVFAAVWKLDETRGEGTVLVLALELAG
ncbi:hypothetical protein D3C81_1808100 [compost metagenome]